MRRREDRRGEKDQRKGRGKDKEDVWDKRRERRTGERGRRRRRVQIPPEEVEKCDLVPRPGDISSTQLIDF